MTIKPENLSPFSNAAGDSIVRPVSVIAAVSVLLNVSGPSAIFWAVVSIIIDAIKALTCRPLSHVSKEVFKVFPALANLYSTASVVRPARHSWVSAPSEHACPNAIGGCWFSNMMTMLRSLFVNLVSRRFSATARCSLTILKLTDICKRLVTAVTKTFPHHLFCNPNICGFDRCKAVKLHA
jgi:hypothetical protein